MHKEPNGAVRRKHKSRSFNEQQNMAEFAEEAQTLQASKAKERPPSLNHIEKKITE